MPWLKVKPMDAKVLFISDCLRNNSSFAELCRQHGISRKTGYKWLQRYHSQGIEGLQEQSRRPQNSPEKIPHVIRKEIIALRKRFKHWGAKKIHQLLSDRHPEWEMPSDSSIYNILKAAGAVSTRKRRRRVARTPGPLSAARQPNELWSADYKGQFLTGDGVLCYPLTIMDHASRYLLSCDIVSGTGYAEARTVFERIFRQYGLPQRIRTDNGVPFASTSVGGLSRLSVWWINLGIIPERIEPGKPQQNGRHERMHRTLKQETASPPARSVKKQQACFDAFHKSYNEIRPHEAIGMMPPTKIYQASKRWMPESPEALFYPGHFEISFVNQNGCIWLHGESVYIGYLLKGHHVGVEEVDENLWDVCFGALYLGSVKKNHVQKLIFTDKTQKV